MRKMKISKGLIKIGVRPEELDDLVRICRAAIGFAEERGIGDLEDKAETWKRNFKLILDTHTKNLKKGKED